MPIYMIKEYFERTPDPSRTIFYYDFEDSNNRLADSSGNANNARMGLSMKYVLEGQQYVATPYSDSGGIWLTSTIWTGIGSWDFTISFWIYPVLPPTSSYYPMMFGIFSESSPYDWPTIFFDPYGKNSSGDAIKFRMVQWGDHYWNHTASSLVNRRHHIVMTRNDWVISCYIDNKLDTTRNDNTSVPVSSADGWLLSRGRASSIPQYRIRDAKWDKFILENVGRSAADVSNYYNTTKSLYLSS